MAIISSQLLYKHSVSYLSLFCNESDWMDRWTDGGHKRERDTGKTLVHIVSCTIICNRRAKGSEVSEVKQYLPLFDKHTSFHQLPRVNYILEMLLLLGSVQLSLPRQR